MSEAQSEAAKRAWAKRRERDAEAAALTAQAAADAVPEEAIESMNAEITADRSDNDRPPVKVTPDHSTRMAAMEEIRKSREAEEAEEPTHEEEPPEASTEAAPEAETKVETPAAPEAPEVVAVKVDGQVFQVSKADVDAEGGVVAYQINRAAERRLQKAQEYMRAQADALAKTQQSLAPPKPSVDELIREKIANVQFGTPEEATEAIKEIVSSLRGPQVDPEQIKRDTIDAFMSDSAAREFVRRNAYLMKDPLVQKLAVIAERDMIQAQGKPQDWNTFYQSLEVSLRNTLGRPTSTANDATLPTSQPTSGSVANKDARKASIVALPSAAARAVAPEEPKPKTREEVLAQLKRARGQAV
jgi:hypothetical protein